jgi:hypothetical protein
MRAGDAARNKRPAPVVVGREQEVVMAQSVRTDRIEERVSKARKRVEEQRAKLQRLIVQGAPTQAAEDLLCKLSQDLRQLTRHARSSPAP